MNITFDTLYSQLMEIRSKISGLANYLKDSDQKGYKFNESEEDYGK